MKRYEKYKPACLEWIGDVPVEWKTMHIKFTSACKNGLFIDGDWIESKDLAGDSGTIRYLTSGNVGVIKYKEQGDGYITKEKFDELLCTEVMPGDILISRLNEPIGRACIVPKLDSKIVCAVDNVIFRPNNSLYDRRFLVYQMNCKAYSDYTNCLARGTGMHRISRAMLGQISIMIPSLPEQTSIANFLDEKCAKIDNVVEVQQKRIELLKELKQSIITHAVTKGLDKNAKMKDSSVDWIGKVPEHWEVKSLKFFVEVADGTHDTPKSVEQDDNTFPLVTSKCVENGIINFDLAYHISKNDYEEISKRSYVKKFDVIMPMIGTVGNPAIVTSDDKFAIKNVALFRTVSNYEKAKWLVYLLNSTIVKNNLESLNRGGVQNFVSQDIIKNMKLIFPPLAEQTAIAAYLDKKCATIDAQIAKVERQIDLLNEYKQSVITECVTGQRKVC